MCAAMKEAYKRDQILITSKITRRRLSRIRTSGSLTAVSYLYRQNLPHTFDWIVCQRNQVRDLP